MTLLSAGASDRQPHSEGRSQKSELQECMEDDIQSGPLSPSTLVTLFGNIPALGSFSHQESYYI